MMGGGGGGGGGGGCVCVWGGALAAPSQKLIGLTPGALRGGGDLPPPLDILLNILRNGRAFH